MTGGRYVDYADFDYMRGMGIWIVNFFLPAVCNGKVLVGRILEWQMLQGEAVTFTAYG